MKILDGSIGDWLAAERLDQPTTGASGYAFFGASDPDAFYFAISSDSVQIGQDTTIWLDTDLNRATGYQIWGFTGGAEYNINIAADGSAALYTGDAGETFVGDLQYAYSPDGQFLELAVPKSLLPGNPAAVRVLADVNNSVFLPNDYANVDFVVGGTTGGSGGTYGTITLDGDLADWAPGARLDTPASGTAGYALYGDVQGDALVFAMSADSVAIGANSTIWLDTDLDRATGYQIWGFTGGAEYNINIAADGSAALYTGGEGETFVSDIDYFRSADGQTIEFGLPTALIGGATSARIFADVNDAAYLPNDYSNIDIVVGGQNGGTTVVYGDITLDGDLADWAPITRLDTPTTGTAGYAFYGDVEGSGLVFAIGADAVSVGANTTIWLDTDLDRATGHQIFGFTGGAEYNINIATDGSAALYTGGAGETFVSNIDYYRSADSQTVEFGLPSSLIGGATSARVFADVNNSAFLPNDYANIDFIVDGQNNGQMVSFGNITLDGDLNDWAPTTRLDTPTTGTAGYAIYGDVQADALVFALNANAVSVGSNTTIWLDTDLDRATGYQIFGVTGGAEYNINIATDGSAALYTGGAGETFVTNIDYYRSADGQTVEFGLLSSLIGGATSARVYADVNDTAFLPNDYANVDFLVGVQNNGQVINYGNITLDGDLSDWAPGTRLDTPETGSPGYALHGDVQGSGMLFAIDADTVSIGANTTIWLDTDLNRDTGYQIWGFAGGAEYNVNIAADGSAALYTGGAGETFVADVDFYRSSDGMTLEIAVPTALIGDVTAARVYADVNDAAFLPNDYTNIDFIVEPAPGPADDPELRVGIVYSDTTAINFYDESAYTKLFMSAQHQAMQAGVPFDILSESDLTDPEALASYDALIFPGFSHVQAADLTAIESALATASTTYGVSLIAAGNFLTNDETGASLSGDAYARMKSLLGVTLDSFGQTQGIDLVAGSGTNPILSSYAPGELVGSYSNVSYLTFSDVSGTGEVLFNQVLTDPVTGASTESGAIATTVGARNVHFASDAIIGNNNILGSAIDWVTQDDAPDVSMTLTRGSSLFYSRNDMDQAQEAFDVYLQDPGIYDVMLPIVENWYNTYGFVGSYYIDIGANPPDQVTDWSISSLYYNQLLAMESEIGSHSWTHPDNTNLLQEDTAELLALIDLVDPRNPDHVDPWTLTDQQQQLLFDSYRFQFETSRYEIEAQLGIPITGAAVPGAPEVLSASREIMQYYDYLSGGYSGIGAGYFGAFGYLTPNDVQQVYLAPNMSFDFSLIGFQGLTPAEAEAVWAQEYAEITDHATAPIIAFPWHDYGPTNWDLGDPDPDTYTLEMFETVISRAAADGTEFVTGLDLAERIESFAQSSLSLTSGGDVITAVVTSPDAGSFALDIGASGSIQSVTGWYAYDDDQVFLPRAGGTFEINLGANPVDVTHITALPMRADLISVSGDGQDLEFSFNGRGDVEVALASQGSSAIRISGADSALVTAGVATLGFGTVADHTSTISYFDTATIAGTAGTDFTFGSDAGEVLSASAGTDSFWGGGGADEFVFGVVSNDLTVFDFAPGSDVLHLLSLGFQDSQEAVQAFVQTAEGALLTIDSDSSVLLSDLSVSSLSENDILIT